MKSENAPETPATKFLRQHGIATSVGNPVSLRRR